MINILSISGILPVPGYISSNDFVFEFYENYLLEFRQDNICFILPLKHSNKYLKKISQDSFDEKPLRNLKKYQYKRFEIHILRYLSSWRRCNLHSLLSMTLYFFNLKFIHKLIKQNEIDVVHAQYIFPDGMLAYFIWKKFKIPYIIASHNELRYFEHFISSKLAGMILRNACCITPVNFSNYKTLLQNNLKNVQHIPLGFQEEFLNYSRKDDHEEVRIITIAGLIKLKNIDKVILALNMLKERYHFRYSIVGDGPEKENLENLIHQHHLHEEIQLIGKIPHDKVAEILSEHDIFIMPSYFETFGRVYFEAMALKLPVICAKNSGIYGLFEEMKQGISVDHTDINDIADKLEILISDKSLRERIGKNGYQLVKNYTWKNISIRYNQIYHESINHPCCIA